jgi:hypothetical protein
MGMFDYIVYRDEVYQTKDTPSQMLDKYEIKQDQTSGHFYLWHEEYESDWVDDEDRFAGGYMKQYNHRWVACKDFDGEIRFYRTADDNHQTWIEYKSLFMDGRMLKIREIFDEPLTKWYREGVEQKELK